MGQRNVRSIVSGILVLILALSALPAIAQERQPKLAQLFVHADYLYADGVWRADDLSEKTELAFDTVTRIECYKHGGRDMVGSDAYCLQATAAVMFGLPNIETAYFPVIAWDADKVIAADSSTDPLPVCTWTQITVNLHDHSIMATDTRKLGKGHEGLNDVCKEAPLAQTYHLLDKAEELARRRVRAAQLAKSGKQPN